MSYDQFWLRYLRAHAKPETRLLHYCGSLLALACLLVALFRLDWRFLVAAPVLGYGFAWAGHALAEHNRPATFKYPGWSLLADFNMWWLWLTGRLGPHLDAAGVERVQAR